MSTWHHRNNWSSVFKFYIRPSEKNNKKNLFLLFRGIIKLGDVSLKLSTWRKEMSRLKEKSDKADA